MTWSGFRWHWAAAGLALIALAWLVTEGDWNFFPPGGFLEQFYDAQARSLLHARIDVEPEAIHPESFIRDGKHYGYFGPSPAVMRLPLELLFPAMHGRWSRLFMWLASALVIACLLLLLHKLERQLPAGGDTRLRNVLTGFLVLALVIGSVGFYVSAEAKVYQEAVIWGGAWSFAHAVFLSCLLLEGKRRWLAASCATALLAFFARSSSGAGPLFSLLFAALLPVPKAGRRSAIPLIGTLAASILLWAGLNCWKFGDPLSTLPVSLSEKYDRARLEGMKQNYISLYNLPLTVTSYFSPANISFRAGFPWVSMTRLDINLLRERYPLAHLDMVEPFASVPAATPGLLLAALAGVVLCAARPECRFLRVSMAGALAGGAVVLTYGALSNRYLYDMFAWLALGAAVGVSWIPHAGRRSVRYALAALFIGATVYSMWAQFAFGIAQQRTLAAPIRPEKQFQYWDVATTIDSKGWRGLFDYLRYTPVYVPVGTFPSGRLVERGSELDNEPLVLERPVRAGRTEYTVRLRKAGAYDLAIRHAGPAPSSIRVRVNGGEARDVGLLAGGPQWAAGGTHALRPGENRLVLEAGDAFPSVTMLRFTPRATRPLAE